MDREGVLQVKLGKSDGVLIFKSEEIFKKNKWTEFNCLIVKWIDPPPFFFVYNLDMANIYISYLANQLRLSTEG